MVRVKHQLPIIKIIDIEPRTPNYCIDIVSKAKSQYCTSLLPTLGQPADTANTGKITPAQVSASYAPIFIASVADRCFSTATFYTTMSSQPINGALPTYSKAQQPSRTIMTQYQGPLLVIKHLMMIQCLQPYPCH